MDLHSPTKMLLIISWVLMRARWCTLCRSRVLERFCECVCIRVRGSERTAECQCPSLVVQLHLYDSHLHSCICRGKKRTKKERNTQSDQKYLSMHANAVYLNVFITFPRPDIYDKCLWCIYRFRYWAHCCTSAKIHCSISCTGVHNTDFCSKHKKNN